MLGSAARGRDVSRKFTSASGRAADRPTAAPHGRPGNTQRMAYSVRMASLEREKLSARTRIVNGDLGCVREDDGRDELTVLHGGGDAAAEQLDELPAQGEA